MPAPFRTTTQDEVDTFAGEADRLFWMLDSLHARTNDFLLIESVADPSRFVQASRQDDGVYVLEVKEGAAEPRRGARAADVLDVHQAILAWTRGESAWESEFAWRELSENNGYSIGDAAVRPVADEPADYALTGLSIQDAMLHRARIDRQLGRPVVTPPIVTWGAHLVRTGDIITGIAERGAVTVSLMSASPAYRQGVMLVAPHGSLARDGERLSAEFVLWADAGVEGATLNYVSPGGTLLVTNVYEIRGLDQVRVEKWTQNAGMSVEQNSLVERTYHCNCYETTPPTFDDLVFRLAVEQARRLAQPSTSTTRRSGDSRQM